MASSRAERKTIDAFEMWCWRRTLRIPWTAKRTNISILEQLRINTRLSTLCYKNILSYFGHIVRRLPSNMDKLILVGKVEDKKPRSRSPNRWSDQVKPLTGLPITEAIEKAEDGTVWITVVKIATKEPESGHDLQ
ncbi:jg14024 [Pararge aegeria aegeria]|uniref:Jg14024 protein n=1 Tax=Pararge aegeria aegeria TaxID=348720 RepID=A0A8S4R280_9NEOP|nr:jg14024 [Pararge aegeria aegeria]